MVAAIAPNAHALIPASAFGPSAQDRVNSGKQAISSLSQANANWSKLRTQAASAQLQVLSGQLKALRLYSSNGASTAAQATDLTQRIRSVVAGYVADNGSLSNGTGGSQLSPTVHDLLTQLQAVVSQSGVGQSGSAKAKAQFAKAFASVSSAIDLVA